MVHTGTEARLRSTCWLDGARQQNVGDEPVAGADAGGCLEQNAGIVTSSRATTTLGITMKGLLIAIGIIAALYLGDQRFNHGQYTDAVHRMASQMRHSFGV